MLCCDCALYVELGSRFALRRAQHVQEHARSAGSWMVSQSHVVIKSLSGLLRRQNRALLSEVFFLWKATPIRPTLQFCRQCQLKRFCSGSCLLHCIMALICAIFRVTLSSRLTNAKYACVTGIQAWASNWLRVGASVIWIWLCLPL